MTNTMDNSAQVIAEELGRDAEPHWLDAPASAPGEDAACVDPERDRALVQLATRTTARAERAAVRFLLGTIVAIFTAIATWHYMARRCAEQPLACAAVVSFLPLRRRVRAGSPPPAQPAEEWTASARSAPSQPELPEGRPPLRLVVQQALDAARADGRAAGEREGYLAGARSGRLAWFCIGLVAGALGVATATLMGWSAGA